MGWRIIRLFPVCPFPLTPGADTAPSREIGGLDVID